MISPAVIPRCPTVSAARSPASPCTYTPSAASITGENFFSAARYIHCIPASTPLTPSQLPAVAIPALPEMFKYISPKASATTVQASFRTQTAPDYFA